MNTLRNTLIVLALLSLTACKKDWLDIKQNKKQVVPQTLNDFQALLDDNAAMNIGIHPYLSSISADEYYITTDRWSALTDPVSRNAYIWAKDIFENEQGSDWNNLYKIVLYANSALAGIEKIQPGVSEQELWNNVKGSALFYRSWAFYQLSQLFCKQYDPATASSDLGIPLRLDADINKVSTRASVQAAYDQMLADLQNAVPLLPPIPVAKTRPSKAAALALLSKAQLQMGRYEDALQSADASIQIYGTLIDYKKLDDKAAFPITQMNAEVLFHTSSLQVTILLPTRLNVDTIIYKNYEDQDLRKKIFFYAEGKNWKYKGSYDGTRGFFGGLATDEVYLIRSECYARIGQTVKALADLNKLLENRMNPFVALVETDPQKVLDRILMERRKELIFRGTRWADLRRFNADSRYRTVLRRQLETAYTLNPGDNNYVLPIPKMVIEMSGMTQNPRD